MVKQSLVKIVLGVLVKDRVARVDADLEQLISGQTPLPLSLLSDSAFLRAVALMPLFLSWTEALGSSGSWLQFRSSSSLGRTTLGLYVLYHSLAKAVWFVSFWFGTGKEREFS